MMKREKRATQPLQEVLERVMKRDEMGEKVLEQKIFDLWREHPIVRRCKTVPVGLSNGVLKVHVEHSTAKSGLLLHAQQIIDDINIELRERTPVMKLRIDVKTIKDAPPAPTEQPRESVAEAEEETAVPVPPEKMSHIEHLVEGVVDTALKKSLYRLFIAQSQNKD